MVVPIKLNLKGGIHPMQVEWERFQHSGEGSSVLRRETFNVFRKPQVALESSISLSGHHMSFWILKGGQDLDQKGPRMYNNEIMKEFGPFSGMQSTECCEVGHLRLFMIWSLPSFFRLLSSTNNVCFSSPKMFVPSPSSTPPTPQHFCVLLCFFTYAVSLPQNVPIPPYHQHPSLGPCLLMIIHSIAQESPEFRDSHPVIEVHIQGARTMYGSSTVFSLCL